MNKKSIPDQKNHVFFYRSPVGVLEVQLKSGKIYSVLKMVSSRDKAKRSFNSESSIITEPESEFITEPESKLVQQLRAFLDIYFSGGDKVQHIDFPLFSRGTVFQKKVWRHLCKIPYGQTSTYAEVAKKIGAPGAARAVGSACARNPYLILVPCHRVVAQNSLGGFALGLSAKMLLLNHEKVTAPPM